MNTVIGRVPSSKGDGTEYVVVRTDEGRVICGCPGFSYRRTCRHVGTFTIPARPARVDDLYPPVCASGGHLYVMDADNVQRCWHCKEIK